MSATALRNVRLLYVYWFLRDFQLWIPVWIVFLTLERGFSLTQVTAAEGLFLVGVIILEVPTGAVADHWGRSRSMGLGALCLGGAVLLFAFTTSFAILLASFWLWSLAQALMSGADMALLFDTLKESGEDARYERVAGRGSAFSWSGAGIATLFGGPVAALLDIRATILIGAGTCVGAAVIALLLHEPARKQQAAPERYLQSIRSAAGEIWHTADVRTVVLLAGTTYAAMEAVHYLVQPYLVDRGVKVGVTFSLLQGPMLLAGIAGALAADRIRGRTGTLPALLLLPLLAAMGYLALMTAPGLAAYPSLPLLFVFGATLFPIASGYVNRSVSSERRATVLSMQGMVSSLVLAVLAPGIGFVTDEWGLRWAFGATVLVTLGSLAAFGPSLVARRTIIARVPLAVSADA